jgi:N-acetylglutamate synthase-like GNAT family acetyltransferase
MERLARAAYRHYIPRIGREPAPMAADYVSAVARGHSWVAEDNGRLVGLLVLEPERDHLLLEIVAVAPDCQGRGVGSVLLALAEEQAVALHLPEVRLYTHEAMAENLRYYPRRGYAETHRETRDGFSRVFFAKAVS